MSGKNILVNLFLINFATENFFKIIYTADPEMRNNSGILHRCRKYIRISGVSVVTLFFTCQFHVLNIIPE
jgi:hypothetical protein